MPNTKVVYINFPTLRLFVSEIWPVTRVDLSVTYDLDLWPKILKIILHNEDSTSNMYVKFQNNRLKTVVCRARSGLRTEPHTQRETHRQREHYSLSARLKSITYISNLTQYALGPWHFVSRRMQYTYGSYMSRYMWNSTLLTSHSGPLLYMILNVISDPCVLHLILESIFFILKYTDNIHTENIHII